MTSPRPEGCESPCLPYLARGGRHGRLIGGSARLAHQLLERGWQLRRGHLWSARGDLGGRRVSSMVSPPDHWNFTRPRFHPTEGFAAETMTSTIAIPRIQPATTSLT